MLQPSKPHHVALVLGAIALIVGGEFALMSWKDQLADKTPMRIGLALVFVGIPLTLIGSTQELSERRTVRKATQIATGALPIAAGDVRESWAALSAAIGDHFGLAHQPQAKPLSLSQMTAGHLNEWLTVRLNRFNFGDVPPPPEQYEEVRSAIATILQRSPNDIAMSASLAELASRRRRLALWVKLMKRFPDALPAPTIVKSEAICLAWLCIGLTFAAMFGLAHLIDKYLPGPPPGHALFLVLHVVGWIVFAGIYFGLILLILRFFGRYLLDIPRECSSIAHIALRISKSRPVKNTSNEWTDSDVWLVLQPMVAKVLKMDADRVDRSTPLG